jgi:hypothetical protein
LGSWLTLKRLGEDLVRRLDRTQKHAAQSGTGKGGYPTAYRMFRYERTCSVARNAAPHETTKGEKRIAPSTVLKALSVTNASRFFAHPKKGSSPSSFRVNAWNMNR